MSDGVNESFKETDLCKYILQILHNFSAVYIKANIGNLNVASFDIFIFNISPNLKWKQQSLHVLCSEQSI